MIPQTDSRVEEGSDPRLAIAADRLAKQVAFYFRNCVLDDQTKIDVVEFVAHRVRAFRDRGIDFPRMTALMLPRYGKIVLLRRDLSEADVRQAIVNLTREFKDVTPYEIAVAVSFAFPEYMRKVAN